MYRPRTGISVFCGSVAKKKKQNEKQNKTHFAKVLEKPKKKEQKESNKQCKKTAETLLHHKEKK